MIEPNATIKCSTCGQEVDAELWGKVDGSGSHAISVSHLGPCGRRCLGEMSSETAASFELDLSVRHVAEGCVSCARQALLTSAEDELRDAHALLVLAADWMAGAADFIAGEGLPPGKEYDAIIFDIETMTGYKPGEPK